MSKRKAQEIVNLNTPKGATPPVCQRRRGMMGCEIYDSGQLLACGDSWEDALDDLGLSIPR